MQYLVSRVGAVELSADGSPLVRCYRRVVPARVRRFLVAVVGSEVRWWVKQVLRRVAGVLGAGRRRALIVSAAAAPLAAREENLHLVCTALDAARIDHFVVRAHSDTAAAVGVGADDRARVVTALSALCRRVPGYVSLPTGGASGVGPAREREQRPYGQGAGRGGAAASRRSWRRLSRAPVVRIGWYRTDPSFRLLLGREYGCDIEFWPRADDRLLAPRPNRAADSLPVDGPHITAAGHELTRLAAAPSPVRLKPVRTRPEFTVPLPDEIPFPVDAVYTWVDGADPAWRLRRDRADGDPYHPEAANDARFISRDELRYSLRSLRQFAPWVRHVYLVTDRQVPVWLDVSVPGLTVVDHTDIFSDPSVLPTFNSHAIESQLHRIQGLSEHFLYFNDDVFLTAPVTPQRFFAPSGLTRYFPSRSLIPHGPVRDDDAPVTVAGKNNRALLRERFGTVIAQKMKHAPQALRRGVLAEIEAEFPDQHRATAANRFRARTDLSIPSSLHHYYAAATGRAVPGDLRYHYVDLSLPDAVHRVGRLLASRGHEVICLNDTVSTQGQADRQRALVDPLLAAHFPVPSPFESPR